MRTAEFDRLLRHACRRACGPSAAGRPRPPRALASTEQLRAAFHVPLAEPGRDPHAVIDALADAAESGLMGNTEANFFGWVMGASSPVSMAVDLLTAVWGQNAAIYQTAPAAADALTDAVIAEIQRENTSFVSGAQWRGRRIMRVSVIDRGTGADDVARLGASIVRAWEQVSRPQMTFAYGK